MLPCRFLAVLLLNQGIAIHLSPRARDVHLPLLGHALPVVLDGIIQLGISHLEGVKTQLLLYSNHDLELRHTLCQQRISRMANELTPIQVGAIDS